MFIVFISFRRQFGGPEVFFPWALACAWNCMAPLSWRWLNLYFFILAPFFFHFFFLFPFFSSFSFILSLFLFLFLSFFLSFWRPLWWPRRAGGGAGHDCLNLNFQKISHRFTRDFTNTDKKIRKWLLYYVKNYFNRKSVEVQRWTPLEIMLNEFCL